MKITWMKVTERDAQDKERYMYRKQIGQNALISVIGPRKRAIKEMKQRPGKRELAKFYGRKKEEKKDGGRSGRRRGGDGTTLDNTRPFSLSNI